MKSLQKYLLTGMIFFYLPAHSVFPAENESEKFILRNWSIESGLPRNTIQALAQTHDGYIWIGTSAGLARFDGVRFTVFSRQNTSILKNDNILCLYEDREKTLWIGTDGAGLYAYRHGEWKNFNRESGLSNDHIRAITGDWQGNLWIGTEYGLNRLSGKGIRIYTVDDGLLDNIITSVKTDNYGNVWTGTLQGGVARIIGDAIQVFDDKDGLESRAITAIHIDHRNIVRVGSLKGVYVFDRSGHRFDEIGWTYQIPVTSFLEILPGQIWIGSMVHGVRSLNNSFDHTSEQLPSGYYVHCLLKDKDGHIWIGTETAGLIQLKPRRILAVSANQGFAEYSVTAVLEDQKGNLWMGLRQLGLCKRSPGGSVENISNRFGLSGLIIKVLYEDHDGSLWFGTRNNGMFRIKNQRIQHYTTEDGLISNHVLSLYRDKKNVMWVGTQAGLCRFLDDKIYKHPADSCLGFRVNTMLETKASSLYAGTENGVYRCVNNAWESLDSASTSDVLALYEDKYGILWMGTNGAGLKIWKDNNVWTITASEGLHDNTILSILEDENDNLWMSTYKGVFRAGRKEILSLLEDKDTFIYPVFYDERDGMPSRQCSGAVNPAAWKTDTGKLLYPTVKGIAGFDPGTLSEKSARTNIILEEVRSDGVPVLFDNRDLNHYKGENYRFVFTATDFSDPEKLYFEYMLKGYDTNYKRLKPDADRSVYYNHLRPGIYTFLVKVTNQAGKAVQKSLLEFEVFTPIYAHPVFILIVVMIALIASSTTVYIRHQRRVNKQIEKYKTSRLNKEITEKTREKLKSLMTAEKLYLNPDLSLKDLSSKLNLHANYISRIINQDFQMSYNDYINMYRIEDVKQKLADPDKNSETVLQIMYDTGFYSKSVFNTAFKKFTGITPSQYRRTHLVNK